MNKIAVNPKAQGLTGIGNQPSVFLEYVTAENAKTVQFRSYMMSMASP